MDFILKRYLAKSKKGRYMTGNVFLDTLKCQKDKKQFGGIYHKTQIELTYNSNHIKGSALSHEQTKYIFETFTKNDQQNISGDDELIETVNHFRCVDYVIENAQKPLTPKMLKHLHYLLKNGTNDSKKDWFVVGDYKFLPNEISCIETCPPEMVDFQIKKLLANYNKTKHKTLEQILEFHEKFERIHPFQDGNGRIGRLIMFKECLANNLTPFIIDAKHKMDYYHGLDAWRDGDRKKLIATCKNCQQQYQCLFDELSQENTLANF